MSNIKHNPLLDIKTISDHYSEKDGIPVSYVCTTELVPGCDIPVDVFFRETPHPEFGNRYFGLYVNRYDQIMIVNADAVEELTFVMVEDENVDLQYSRFVHDFQQFENGAMIDGGRSYVRSNSISKTHTFKVVNGKLEEREYEENEV